MKKYADQKKVIEEYEGSLEDFAQGYLKFGFNREEDGIVYREWAPAVQEAQLIGDFNEWNGSNHKMEKNQFGVWSIIIPDFYGNPVIPHNSRVKFRFKHGNGIWVDRIPAWIKYATVDLPNSLLHMTVFIGTQHLQKATNFNIRVAQNQKRHEYTKPMWE